MSGAGDVDGDGLDDVLVGAEGADRGSGGSNYGAAYLILGSSLGVDIAISLADADYALVGSTRGQQASVSISAAGDVDQDGLSDILVGTDGPNLGYLVLGSSLGADSVITLDNADYLFSGECSSGCYMFTVSDAGDVNGDGVPDLLFGDNGLDVSADNAGGAYLVFGGP